MPLPSPSWTVSCRACDLVIGTVEGGRFVHDPACAHPLAIGSGLLRCCQCGGRLAGDPRPLAVVVDDEDDDAPEFEIAPLSFMAAARRVGEARQRL
jgi:hypothetical protein